MGKNYGSAVMCVTWKKREEGILSYDLFVFDPEYSPRNLAELERWFEEESESEDYSVDPSVMTDCLQTWFREMQMEFPALNGPAAPADIEEKVDMAGDYSMRPHSVLVNFGWSQASRAGESAFSSAQRLSLGLFDPQSATAENGWYLPEAGKLTLVKRRDRKTVLGRFTRLFRCGE